MRLVGHGYFHKFIPFYRITLGWFVETMQMCSLLKTTFYGIVSAHLIKLAAMKICSILQDRSYNAPKTFHWQQFFSLVFAPIFDISINIHEYANEQNFILTHDIKIIVIYGITGAITSCHDDNFGLKFVYLRIFKIIYKPF